MKAYHVVILVILLWSLEMALQPLWGSRPSAEEFFAAVGVILGFIGCGWLFTFKRPLLLVELMEEDHYIILETKLRHFGLNVIALVAVAAYCALVFHFKGTAAGSSALIASLLGWLAAMFLVPPADAGFDRSFFERARSSEEPLIPPSPCTGGHNGGSSV